MTKAQWYQAIQEMKDTIARGDKFKEIHISGHGSAGVAGPFTLQNITNPHSFEAQYLELISTNVGMIR